MMRIVDKRDGTVFSGTLEATIKANMEPTRDQLRAFYKVTPNTPTYDIYKRPMPMDRLVLRRDAGEDYDAEPMFYIVPKYEFYEEVA